MAARPHRQPETRPAGAAAATTEDPQRLDRLEAAVVELAMTVRRQHGLEMFRGTPNLRRLVETAYEQEIGFQ